MQRAKQKRYLPLAIILGLGLVLRLALILATEGHEGDMSCFTAWAFRMADLGPAHFYAPDYFADYPPAYMLVLGGMAKLAKAFSLAADSKGFVLLLTAAPVLCDLGLIWLAWRVASRYTSQKGALVVAAFVAFSPALLYDTAVWKQVDSVLTVFLLAAFWLLSEKKYIPGAVVFGVALAIKPQALLYGPVLALCFAVPLLQDTSVAKAAKTVGRAVLGALAAVAVVVVPALPVGGGSLSWLLEKYTGTMESYPYASVNGFNFATLIGANWALQDEVVYIFSWKTWGTIGIVLSTLMLLYLAWQGAKNDRFCPFLLAGFYGAAIFTVAHRMHERYLVPALLFVLLAAVRWSDRRLFGSFFLLSTAAFLNIAVVMVCIEDGDHFVSTDISSIVARAVSLIEVVGMLLLALGAYAVVRGKKTTQWQPGNGPLKATAPKVSPLWQRREVLFVALLTAVVAVVSLWDLGDTTAPQNELDVINFTASEQITLTEAPTEFRVYPAIAWSGSVALFNELGEQVAYNELGYTTSFTWSSTELTGLAPGSYTVEVNTASVVEIAFWGEQGQIMVTGSDSPLFDEQTLVPETISYRNSMYFDEIYHGRTAYEHLHGMPVYETTHPPLGKVFIMLGIAIFGMTGFGWRVSGVLFGIAMVPVLYLFVRRLTRNTKAAAFAGLLAAFDLLRLSQSRIATIDVYGTFFILLAAYFMLWYCQSMLQKGLFKSLVPLGLAGLSFGLGAASKWTGLYAGAGLAILYFGVLYLRYKQKPPQFKRELIGAFGFGVLFFVIVPLAVYYAAYLPYYWRAEGFGPGQWWQCQVSMYNYHSNLDATHSFESRWYSWPLALRPVWYYMGGGLPVGMYSSIAGMANPVVWWAGIFAVGILLWQQVSGRGSRGGLVVLVLFFTQLVPWMFVTRCTFMYHYFPSLLFSIAALALVLANWAKHRPKAARIAALATLFVAAVVYVWLSPAATGAVVSAARAQTMKWTDSWGFYIF